MAVAGAVAGAALQLLLIPVHAAIPVSSPPNGCSRGARSVMIAVALAVAVTWPLFIQEFWRSEDAVYLLQPMFVSYSLAGIPCP